MLTPDEPRHWLRDQKRKGILQAFLGKFLPGLLDTLWGRIRKQTKPWQQAHAVVVPAQRELVGYGLQSTQRIAKLHALVVAEPSAHNRRTVPVGHLHRERSLAKARPSLHPKDARRRLVIQPVLIGIENPLATGEAIQVPCKAPFKGRGV